MHYSVVSVEPTGDYQLLLEFRDGKRGIYDMSGLLDLPFFTPLRSTVLFKRAFVDGGTVAWPGDIDIAPEELWSGCTPV